MALLIRLPLNGNLNNIGLNNDTFTGTTTYVDGKLGKCLSGSKVACSTSTVPASITTNNVYSVSIWMNYSGTDQCWLYSFGSGTGTMRGIWLNPGGLYWAYSGSGHSFSNVSGLNDGEWHHIAVTTDGSKAYSYVDGVYKSTLTPSKTDKITGTAVTLNLNTKAMMLNDFRVYDHCLTADEVKDIARGLVLHYPLSREGFGQDNLLKESDLLYKSSATWAGINCTYNGSGWFSISGTATNTAAGIRGLYGDGFSTSIINSPGTYTFSFNDENVILAGSFYWQVAYTNTSGTNTYAYVQNTGNQTLTLTVNAINSIRLYVHANASGKTVNGRIRVKCESGTVATPWTPNSTDTLYTSMAVDTLVHDVSGFQHNGTNYGTVAYSADTPRYKVSRVFNGSNNWVTTAKKMDFIKEAVTLTYWEKADNWSSMTGTAVSCIEGGGWGGQKWGSDQIGIEIGTGSSSITWLQYACDTGSFTGWHHFALTYDGYTFKVYVDGVEKYTNTKYTTKTPIYYNASVTANALFIGGECGNSLTTPTDHFAGNVSDVRVYATALSTTEIQDIYKGVM